MVGFARVPPSSGELSCDGVRLAEIAESVGTPVYVYSAAEIASRYRALDEAFGRYPHRLHYALKANSTLAIAALLHGLGAAADANSLWEIEVARRAGFAPADLVFTGVGKTDEELAGAVPLGLRAINVESSGELDRIEAIARRSGLTARVAFRVNPDIDARSHPHISTGLKANKFGIPVDEARRLASGIAARPALRLVAVHVHVGSQISTLEPIARAAALLAGLAADVRAAGVELEYLDLGGGLGIAYRDADVAPAASAYASLLVDAVAPVGLSIVVEPGRWIVGPAGTLVARVVDVKCRDAGSQFAVLDAGMTELLRPALYSAYHRIEPVQPSDRGTLSYEIVGPVCESSDVLGRDRTLPALTAGDLVAIRDAGAYGSAMASNYNRRPIPAEVLVEKGAWRVIRRRQRVDDMLAMEDR